MSNDLLSKLDESILLVLEEVSSLDLPNICAMRSHQKGKDAILKLVRERIMSQGDEIYEALECIEQQLLED